MLHINHKNIFYLHIYNRSSKFTSVKNMILFYNTFKQIKPTAGFLKFHSLLSIVDTASCLQKLSGTTVNQLSLTVINTPAKRYVFRNGSV